MNTSEEQQPRQQPSIAATAVPISPPDDSGKSSSGIPEIDQVAEESERLESLAMSGVPTAALACAQRAEQLAERAGELLDGCPTDLIEASRRDILEYAAHWYGIGAEQGCPVSAACLGWMLLHGKGIERDVGRAKRWLLFASDHGEMSAACAIGEGCEVGLFGAPDIGKARQWYEFAAKRGSGLAAWNLARLYVQGCGVEPSTVKAYAFVCIAADGGFPLAKALRDDLWETGGITDGQVAEAQQFIKGWRPVTH